MELGATVCTNSAVACGACPLSAECEAKATDRVGELPRPKRKVTPIEVELEVLLIRRDGSVLLQRRAADASKMPGMWELPTRERAGPGLFGSSFESGSFEVGEKLGLLRHSITKHRIRALVMQAESAGEVEPPFAWHLLDATAELALTGMAKKALVRFASFESLVKE